MGTLNSALNAAFGLLIDPLRGLHPLAGLVGVALVMALVALLAFRFASNAAAISRIKSRIGGYLLEMRIYRDDLRVLLLDPLRIFGLNFKYVAHAVGPFLLILPPMLLAIFQIESRYALEPLDPGDRTVVTVAFRDGIDVLSSAVELETSEGLVVETPPVRIPALRETSWRIRAAAAGEQWIRVAADGGAAQTVEKVVWVEGRPRAMARARTARYAGLGALVEPAEAPLPRSGLIEEIRVGYQDSEPRALGLGRSVWIFFVLSTVFGFALKGRMGVTL